MAGGCGGVHPRNLKKGRVINSCNQAASGTQNFGEPKAYEGGENRDTPTILSAPGAKSSFALLVGQKYK